jgi:twinkle protein
MVFSSGNGYCQRCDKSFSKESVDGFSAGTVASQRRTYQNHNTSGPYKKKLTMEDMDHLGYIGDRHRGITPETDRHFGIRTEINPTNATPIARYYPYYVEDTPYGFKNRQLPKVWDTDIGTIKGTDLFGWHLCTGKRHTLIIVEGEEDCAIGWQMWKAMNKRSPSRRIQKQNPHIVSLPNGAKGAQKILLHHSLELEKYEKIIWMGDNYTIDAEGALALEAAVQVLGVDKLFVAEYNDRRKDLCDVWKAEETAEDAINAFSDMYFNAKKYQPADIISGEDVSLEEIEQAVVKGYDLPFESINEMIQGLRLYEHTLIFSGAGMGKSTLCRAIGHWMNTEHNWMVGNIYLEEKNTKTMQGYIAYDNEVALNLYRKNFDSIPKEQREASKKNVVDKMFFLNHNGCIDPDILMNKIRFLYNKGCKLIILDHISMAVTGSDDERKDIDSLMEKIYQFCEHNPVHVLSVVHLNRDSKRDFTRGAEITANNLRGSAGLLQMVWNAIALEGDNQHDEHSNTRFARFLKCRETGEVGLCEGAYLYDKQTGHFNYSKHTGRDVIEQSFEKQVPSMGGGDGKYNNKAT